MSRPRICLSAPGFRTKTDHWWELRDSDSDGAHGKDAGHDNNVVFGLVRHRLSIRVHALAPTLSQRDVLLANVVANGLRRPL